jgi:hypothetical protein
VLVVFSRNMAEHPDTFFDKEGYWGEREETIGPLERPRVYAWPGSRRNAAKLVSGVFRGVVVDETLHGTPLPNGTPIYPYNSWLALKGRGGAARKAVVLLLTEHMRPATEKERAHTTTEPWTPHEFPAKRPGWTPRQLMNSGTTPYKDVVLHGPGVVGFASSDGTHRYQQRADLVCMAPAFGGGAVPLRLIEAAVPNDPTETVGVTMGRMTPEWRPGRVGESQITHTDGQFVEAFRIISAEVVRRGEESTQY